MQMPTLVLSLIKQMMIDNDYLFYTHYKMNDHVKSAYPNVKITWVTQLSRTNKKEPKEI